MKRVIIGIGSNKGDRVKSIIKAIKELEKIGKIKKISSFYENEPVNVSGGYFLNGVIEIDVNFSPEELLNILINIEKNIGRKFPHKKEDEREIDLDIIFYEDKIIKNENLEIPHPEYKKRIFVLKPLCEIEPDFIDPETGEKIKDIYRNLKNEDMQKNI